ncbi:MAG TPA: hypothetical protein DIT63_03380, partial [Gammaproteobacteria bacterium]|nr:hypothetical protein [Gammaproteobacteria bacterium]
FAGTVRELKVKVGDKLETGAVVALIETSETAAPAKSTPSAASERPAQAPAAEPTSWPWWVR